MFSLRQRDMAWITINGDDANSLFIFADPERPAIPTGAKVYGRGVHHIGKSMPLSSNQVVYLDAGVYVIGAFKVKGTSGVGITGNGVLSGQMWEGGNWREDAMICGDNNGTNVEVDGITIVASPTYTIIGAHTVTGVKVLSPWDWTTDAFHVCGNGSQDALVECG